MTCSSTIVNRNDATDLIVKLILSDKTFVCRRCNQVEKLELNQFRRPGEKNFLFIFESRSLAIRNQSLFLFPLSSLDLPFVLISLRRWKFLNSRETNDKSSDRCITAQSACGQMLLNNEPID